MATAARTRPAARSRASKGASTMAGLTGTPATNSAESLAEKSSRSREMLIHVLIPLGSDTRTSRI